jgi:predicted ATPase with chaperone activity
MVIHSSGGCELCCLPGGITESEEIPAKAVMKQLHLSARAFHRVLKLTGTIADLEGADII